MKKDFKKLYLKNTYNKYNSKINIWALLFGGVYLLYKKMYILGAITLILYFISYVFKIYYLIIIINILLFIIFNNIYIKFVEYKIENYKLKYMDSKLVEKECSKNNNNVIIVILTVLFVIIIFFVSKIEFNEKIVRMGNIEFKLQSDWEKGKYNNKYYSVYNYLNKCSVTVERMGFNSDEDFLNDILKNYNVNKDIINININNIDYKMVSVDNSYVYTTYIDNELYVLLFDLYDDYELCNKYKDNILNSVVIYK